MLRHDRSAPIWLFSFVDLAFLLLIAFTQIGPETQTNDLAIGQLEIPHINSTASPLDRNASAPSWQLRVYPIAVGDPHADERTPFELIEPGTRPATDSDRESGRSNPNREHINAGELAAHLRLLHQRQLDKPVLAPHRDSRSEDLLVAVGLLEEVWQTNRAVAVIPGRAVSSGSLDYDAGDPGRQ